MEVAGQSRAGLVYLLETPDRLAILCDDAIDAIHAIDAIDAMLINF
jgi:hypothetical protein